MEQKVVNSIRVIIMADGASKRWNINKINTGFSQFSSLGNVISIFPKIQKKLKKIIGKSRLPKYKQLITIGGETLLRRQVRLLKENGVHDIFIATRHDALKTKGADLYHPIDNNYEIDRFSSSRALWNEYGITLYLYGDVYYTEEAIKTIIGKQTERMWFGRYGSEGEIKNQNSEIFAFCFKADEHQKISDAIDFVRAKYIDGSISRCIGWELYKELELGSVFRELNEESLSKFVNINDMTNDFDTKQEYIDWKNLYDEKELLR